MCHRLVLYLLTNFAGIFIRNLTIFHLQSPFLHHDHLLLHHHYRHHHNHLFHLVVVTVQLLGLAIRYCPGSSVSFGINPKFLDFIPIVPDFSSKAGVFTFNSLSPWALTT